MLYSVTEHISDLSTVCFCTYLFLTPFNATLYHEIGGDHFGHAMGMSGTVYVFLNLDISDHGITSRLTSKNFQIQKFLASQWQ